MIWSGSFGESYYMATQIEMRRLEDDHGAATRAAALVASLVTPTGSVLELAVVGELKLAAVGELEPMIQTWLA